MKKPYAKPDILFEDFSLSTSIATCEVKTNLYTNNSCGVDFGGDIIFVPPINGCTQKVDDKVPPYDQICYHHPTDTSNMFNS